MYPEGEIMATWFLIIVWWHKNIGKTLKIIHRTFSYAHGVTLVPHFPEFIQLLNDDIVSLNALTLILSTHVHPTYVTIRELTLSLYLMTQCQLKLRQLVTSLAQTLDCIEVAQRRHQLDDTMNQLTLKLAERKIPMHMPDSLSWK